VRVLYTTSDEFHAKQYAQLLKEYKKHSSFQFVHEEDFRSDTLALLAPYDYVLFLVDDNIFVRDFSLSDAVGILEKHLDIIGFSLRLGKNTQYCYTLNNNQRFPEFEPLGQGILKHQWTTAEYDFGYPLELSSSIYRVEDILTFFSQLPFKNPNTLEALMDNNKAIFQAAKPYLACYEQSVTFCAPVNIVQSAWTNRISGRMDYSPENLAKLFGEGFRIDVSAFNSFVPNACHQEVELHFTDSNQDKSFSHSDETHLLISIIILNYNRMDDLKLCLDSIRRNTPEKHEIIVVDNASTDGSREYLRTLEYITLIENPTNIGCPPARAQALSLAKGDYVILLDNDTIVTNGWVTKFIAHAEADKTIGILGPRSNHVSGIQQVANIKYRDTTELEEFAGDFAQKNSGKLTPTGRLVGFCMFIRREVIDKIGNIDASFGKFGFEDDDYTLRAMIAGFKALIANDVFIHHKGGPQGHGDLHYNLLLIQTWERYKEKWGFPKDLKYDTPCPVEIFSKIISQPFDPKKHYIPMPLRSEIESLIYTIVPAKESITPAEKVHIQTQNKYLSDMVSIILLVHGELDSTRRCLRSIRKHTPDPHEILFVPLDPSFDPPKWMTKLLKERPNYRLVTPIRDSLHSNKPVIPADPESFLRHTPLSPLDRGESDRFPTLQKDGGQAGGNDNLKNKKSTNDLITRIKGKSSNQCITFSEACNAGVAESRGEYILIVNDGVIVTEGWLSGMLDCLRRADNAGIVGPMMTNLDGQQGIQIQGSGGQGAKGSRETSSAVIARREDSSLRSEQAPQSHAERKDRHAPLAMTDNTPVARNDCKTHSNTRILESLNPEVIQKYAKEFIERNKHRGAVAGRLKDACILFRHTLADTIGPFDDRFRSPELAVEDYCLRAAIAGFNNFIAGDVLLSYSREQLTVEKKRELFREKRSFVSKWSVVDSESLDSQKLHAVNALMASYEICDKGDANKALSILIDGLASSPDDKRLHHAVVELLIRQRRFREALDVLEAMPDSLKQTVRWLELKCVCKDGQQEYDDAYACAEQLLDLNRQSPVALNLIGMKTYRQANHSEAERYFQKAIDSDPGFGEAYANLGAIQWSAKNHESAFALMEKAFILSPTAEEIAVNYHAASVALSRVERATFIFREAASLHPLHKKLKYMLADLLLQQEQYQEAMDVIEEALLAFGIDDDSLTLAGALREKIGAIGEDLEEQDSSEKTNAVIAGSPAPSVIARSETTRQSLSEQRDRHAPLAMTDKTPVARNNYNTTHSTPRPLESLSSAVLIPRTLESSNPTLSICIIVKDEEKNIGKCLRSIKPLADEMIVVDTGSTDRTKEIAKVFGAKVFEFEWTNSFSDARNYSISKASGDWILILDADEVIAPEDFGKIRELIKKGTKEQGPRGRGVENSSEKTNAVIAGSPAPSVIARSETTRQSFSEQRDRHAPLAMTEGEHVIARSGDSSLRSEQAPQSLSDSDNDEIAALPPVARNDHKNPLNPALVAYSLVSRNYVVSMNTTGWTGNDGTYLEHEAGTGWTPSNKVRLFPNDPRIRFEEPVHELVENSLKAAGIPIQKCDVPVHHYGKLNIAKVTEKGRQYYELGKAKFRSDSDLLAIYELALQASELGRYEDALIQWNRFISLMPDYPKAFYGLGYAHYSLKHYEEAFKAFSQSASLAQDEVEWRDAVTLLAHAAIGAGKPMDCIDYLEQLLRKDPEYPMALLLLSIAHACAGDIEKGKAYLDQLEKSNFDGTPYLAYFAEMHLSEQRVAPAVALLNMARKLGRMPTRIAELIAECERRMGEEEQGARGQGVEDSSDEKNNVIARSEATRQSLPEQRDRHAPLAMTEGEHVIARSGDSSLRSEQAPQSLSVSGNDEIAALSQVARNDRQEESSSTQQTQQAQRMQATLSLCMIVKNEEQNIRRALESIKPVVDEMIVVDTGSTDRTKKIAEEMGAKVYDFAWTDSFADARNFAISKATSDWILILDADEVISPLDHEELRKMIRRDSVETHGDSIETKTTETPGDSKVSTSLNQSPSVSDFKIAYLFTTRNYVKPTNVAGWVSNDGKYPAEEAGTGWFRGEKVRLFPNDKSIRFENPVHERIEPSLEKTGISIKQSIIPIHHYGMLDEEKIRAKNEYYYELGKKRLAEKGRQDFRAIYDLAVQASGIGRFNEALEYFQQAIALNPGFAKVHESLGNACYNLRQYDQALASYTKALELDPSSRDALLLAAQCEIIAGNSLYAIKGLEAFLKSDPANGKALFLLAAAYLAGGSHEKGMEYCRKLLDTQSGMVGYLMEFAQLLSAQERTVEAQRLIEAADELKYRVG